MKTEEINYIRNWIRENDLIEHFVEGIEEPGFYFAESDFNEMLSKFKSDACRKQREICARRAWSIQYEIDPRTQGIEYDEFIRNAPEPEGEI